jgi:ABC-type antimicrobial peptide transport system permease subunit
MRSFLLLRLKKQIFFLEKKTKILKKKIHYLFFENRRGRLSWYRIFILAFRNLLNTPSRTVVTVGAMAVGVGAIVFLVSFAYGLQDVVTQRLVQPKSLRLADIQTSSTAVGLTKDKIKEIKKIPQVEDISAAVSLAGSMNIGNSKMDVVVIGADNRFLDYAHIRIFSGRIFSAQAEKKFLGQTELEKILGKARSGGAVLGDETEKREIKIGQLISQNKIYFRLNDDAYYPLRAAPSEKALILGFVQGSLFRREHGFEVYGASYQSVSTVGRVIQDNKGEWWGKWIKTRLPIYEEREVGFYMPALDEAGNQKIVEGYLAEKDVKILTGEEVLDEKKIDRLLEKFQNKASGEAVLGEATASAQTGNGDEVTVAVSLEKTATHTAELEKMVAAQKKEKQATATAELAIVEVKKKDGKEALISTAILNHLKLTPEKILGKNISLSYIISGNLMSGVAGRVLSKPVNYRVVGIVKEDKQLLVFSPLADLESVGVSRYSMAKVVATSEDNLAPLRGKIEAMGFSTQSIVDTLTQVRRLFGIMRFLLGAFGMIAFVVAIFGMFNTLTVSLLERTREVGVMKTLGTTDYDVLRLFLAESLIIGLVGGVLGIGLGKWLGEAINFISIFFRADKTISLFKTPFSFVLLILFLSLLVSFFTGLYPARRAKTINPLDALRYE